MSRTCVSRCPDDFSGRRNGIRSTLHACQSCDAQSNAHKCADGCTFLQHCNPRGSERRSRCSSRCAAGAACWDSPSSLCRTARFLPVTLAQLFDACCHELNCFVAAFSHLPWVAVERLVVSVSPCLQTTRHVASLAAASDHLPGLRE